MTEQTLTRHRIFGAWALEKEEQWLSKMAAEGWQLEDVGFLTYHFKKTTPQQIQYQLDYQSLNRDERDDYLALFAESGWEHCASYTNLWFYFRKPKINGREEHIHTDNASRIKLLTRVLITLIISGFPSWMALINFSTIYKRYQGGVFIMILYILITCIVFLMLFSCLRILMQISKLKKAPQE